jgi:hypothetical protein
MQSRGFEESQAAYVTEASASLVGQFRRFGEEGPAYEVLRLVDKASAMICVVYSEEQLAYPIADILADPVAETIP